MEAGKLKIKYTKQALKTLKGYDKQTIELIRGKIRGLTKTPPVGDIKPLQGSKTEKRLRAGMYRVIFEYLTVDGKKVLMINKVDSRGDAYK